METLNVHEAKSRLSAVLADIESKGTSYIICRNGKPIARIVPHETGSRLLITRWPAGSRSTTIPPRTCRLKSGGYRLMLLDTCALLWLSHDQSQISDSTRAMIEKAPVVSIAAVTAFEVGLKHRSGKLKLPMPPRRWLDTVLSHHRIAVIGLDLEICLVATELPPIHKDPCDLAPASGHRACGNSRISPRRCPSWSAVPP